MSLGRQGGFTLLAVLFMVAALGVGMAAVGTMWETAVRREKEAQLLFVGDQYRHAIERYHQATPGGVKSYPGRLEDLLLDRRFPQTVRHLRQSYPDPVTGKPEWGLVKDGEGITGVYSLSQGMPMKQAGFDAAHKNFEGRARYSDWVFVAFMDKPQVKADIGQASQK